MVFLERLRSLVKIHPRPWKVDVEIPCGGNIRDKSGKLVGTIANYSTAVLLADLINDLA